MTTDDGYQLNLFRVRKQDLKEGAPVMFFQHGILDSADAWVVNDESSPAFIAAKAGYDVWCGNQRGTRFSKKHDKYDPYAFAKDERYKYWNFSFQEMAEHDGKTFLNKIEHETGVKKVTWIGHQQGATQIFYALADDGLRDFYAQRLNLFVALGPVTRLNDMNSEFIKAWSKVQGLLEWLTYVFGIFEAFGDGQRAFNHIFCEFVPKICNLSFEML